jgi:hypothetical protein
MLFLNVRCIILPKKLKIISKAVDFKFTEAITAKRIGMLFA